MAQKALSLIFAAASVGLVLSKVTVAQEVDVYGQLNLGFVSVDNGVIDETAFTDNDNSNSRVGATFTRALDGGDTFRLHFETALGFTGSSALNGTDNGFEVHYRRTELRKVEAVYVSADFGTFYFGQGSISTDGVAEADFSGTTVIAHSALADQAGSQEFQLLSGGGAGVDVGDAFGSFDGGRRFRVRYDTPAIGGFTFSASAGEEVLRSGDDNEYYDFGARYAADYGEMKVAAGAGYSIRGTAEELLMGSVAVLHGPTGLSLAVSGGRQQEGDADYGYIKAGLKRSWFGFGETRFSADYYSGGDFVIAGTQSTSYGLAVVQTVDAYNLELYASLRRYDYDQGAAAVLAQDVRFVGVRWKF